MIQAILAFFVATISVAYFTNPFSKFTIIQLPYRIHLRDLTHTIMNRNHRLTVRSNWFWRLFAWYQCGIYILSTRYLHQATSSSTTVSDIIADIHQLRFDPNRLLLISGDHFNGLFVRNLGIFFYPTLDANIYTTKDDWRNRQEVYLQSLAFALGSFQKHPHLKTTIVSTGRYATTNINFYSYPSDSLYGMLYCLSTLLGKERAGAELYSTPERRVNTIPAAKELLREYAPLLTQLYNQYHEMVFDSETSLIRTDIHLSGAKDITKRQSSFYDNVIYWKTTKLAMSLGIIPKSKNRLHAIKQTILATFWLEKPGYFVEDLSPESIKEQLYSSDWLIVLSTGFLNIANAKERRYYERSLAYINKHNIARPFAIKYQNETRAHRQFLAVRIAVASYGGNSIWSFWGMEFIKVNLLLSKYTGTKSYVKEADFHIKRYKQNIIRFKGFPEVYNEKGEMLQTLLYKSICMTGWVIGFEQVLAMRNALSEVKD